MGDRFPLIARNVRCRLLLVSCDIRIEGFGLGCIAFKRAPGPIDCLLLVRQGGGQIVDLLDCVPRTAAKPPDGAGGISNRLGQRLEGFYQEAYSAGCFRQAEWIKLHSPILLFGRKSRHHRFADFGRVGVGLLDRLFPL